MVAHNSVDLTGHTYGRLRVLRRAGSVPRGRGGELRAAWECLCDPSIGGCGRTAVKHSNCLRSGNTKSCGCGGSEREDLTGRRFGRLVVVAPTGARRGARRAEVWRCVCDCGKEHESVAPALRAGHVKSCGCLAEETTPAADRFNSKVDRSAGSDGCWMWTAVRDPKSGYGKFYIGARRFTGAHRASYSIHNGPIPEGMFVLHRCDTPSCVNPAHLFLGTHLDNMADMIAKGRGTAGRRVPAHFVRRGDRHHSSKITEAQVEAARARQANGEKLRDLAAELGVAPSTLCHRIRGRRRYRDTSESRA